MKIYKRNIAWATLTLTGIGVLAYDTDDCDGVRVLVRRIGNQLGYTLDFRDADYGSPYRSLTARLTPQAWAAIQADVKPFLIHIA